MLRGFPSGWAVKNVLHCRNHCKRCKFDPWARKIPGPGRSPGEGNGNPCQYPSLDNPMDRGAWWAIVHGVKRVGHDLTTTTTVLRGLYSPPTLFTNLEFFHYEYFEYVSPLYHVRLGICTGNIDEVILQTFSKNIRVYRSI